MGRIWLTGIPAVCRSLRCSEQVTLETEVPAGLRAKSSADCRSPHAPQPESRRWLRSLAIWRGIAGVASAAAAAAILYLASSPSLTPPTVVAVVMTTVAS